MDEAVDTIQSYVSVFMWLAWPSLRYAWSAKRERFYRNTCRLHIY